MIEEVTAKKISHPSPWSFVALSGVSRKSSCNIQHPSGISVEIIMGEKNQNPQAIVSSAWQFWESATLEGTMEAPLVFPASTDFNASPECTYEIPKREETEITSFLCTEFSNHASWGKMNGV